MSHPVIVFVCWLASLSAFVAGVPIDALGFEPSFADYGRIGPYATFSYEQLIRLPAESTGCVGVECDMLVLVTSPRDSSSSSFPLALFSPGFNTQPSLYANTIAHLSSWGYVVVGLNPNETLFRDITHNKKGLFVPAVLDWAEGQNTDPSSPLYRKVDSSKVYSLGHSLGGKSSYLGASYDTKRIAGVFAIDPVDCEPGCIFPDNSVCEYDTDYPSAAARGNYIAPGVAMILGAELGGVSRGGPACAPTKCNYEWFFNQTTSGQWSIMFYNTGHTQYVDLVPPPAVDPCTQGTQSNDEIKRLTQTLMVAWAEKTIRNQNIDEYLTGSWMQEQVAYGKLLPKVKQE